MLNKRLIHWNIIVFLIVFLIVLHIVGLVGVWFLLLIMKSLMSSQVVLALESFTTDLASVKLEICIVQQAGLGEIISLASLQMFQQLILL